MKSQRFGQISYKKVSISISVMSETSNQLGIATAVPVHPKPMVEGGGGFWRGWRGTGVVIDYISHHQL